MNNTTPTNWFYLSFLVAPFYWVVLMLTANIWPGHPYITFFLMPYPFLGAFFFEWIEPAYMGYVSLASVLLQLPVYGWILETGRRHGRFRRYGLWVLAVHGLAASIVFTLYQFRSV